MDIWTMWGCSLSYRQARVPRHIHHQILQSHYSKRQDEFRHMPTLKIEEVTSASVISLGKLKIKFFDITHAIPDAIGVIIETPYGNVIYPGDFRIELDENSKPVNIGHYEKLGKENNLVLFLESTNAEEPGFSIPEKVVYQNLEKWWWKQKIES